ncbi:MAG: flagellar hook-basal body complex protein FliE [Rhodospirillales bacterium]|nr:flagellar hook-basal body complex protein FliE [Rhodospirillales bacterium]
MPTPTQNISNVLTAYTQAARGAGGGLEARDAVQGGDQFADLVKGALEEARRIGERSEQMSIEGIRDNADLSQVITAVAEAESTLQTVVAVRDKVVEAYKQIVRMPI